MTVDPTSLAGMDQLGLIGGCKADVHEQMWLMKRSKNVRGAVARLCQPQGSQPGVSPPGVSLPPSVLASFVVSSLDTSVAKSLHQTNSSITIILVRRSSNCFLTESDDIWNRRSLSGCSAGFREG